jgi:branched-subunit amino acid transport protein
MIKEDEVALKPKPDQYKQKDSRFQWCPTQWWNTFSPYNEKRPRPYSVTLLIIMTITMISYTNRSGPLCLLWRLTIPMVLNRYVAKQRATLLFDIHMWIQFCERFGNKWLASLLNSTAVTVFEVAGVADRLLQKVTEHPKAGQAWAVFRELIWQRNSFGFLKNHWNP